MRALLASTAVAAALIASASGASAQQRGAYCLRGGDSGALDCSYNTMAQCEEAKKGANTTGTCVANDEHTGAVGQAIRPAAPANPPPAKR
jgi:hypothetical protein